MGAIPGSVRVTGFIAPTDSEDTYPVTDTIYGVDGLRNFSGDSSVLSGITVQRRRAGMIAGTISNGVRMYYRLNSTPWDYTSSDWAQLTLYDYTGQTNFTSVESAYWKSGSTATSLLTIQGDNTATSPYSFVGGGSGNTASALYSSAGGLSNTASGNSQVVIGRYAQPQGTNSFTATDYGMILGGGTGAGERANAAAITWEGMIQMRGFSGATLPSTNTSDGAIAYSANTGLFQYINGAWTGLTSGGGNKSWQETIIQNNIVTEGSPTISGESLTFRTSSGARDWYVRADSDDIFMITGDTYGALRYVGKTLDILREDGVFFKSGSQTNGNGFISAYNGTRMAGLDFSSLLTADRNWSLPDASGTIALVSQLTGNTGGAPQTLAFNTTTIWNLEFGHNAFLILTADTTLNVSNVSAGDYGTLLVKQDASGGHALAPPGSSAVVNGAGGLLNITSNSGSEDIVTFYYTGTKYYWTIGGDYT